MVTAHRVARSHTHVGAQPRTSMETVAVQCTTPSTDFRARSKAGTSPRLPSVMMISFIKAFRLFIPANPMPRLAPLDSSWGGQGRNDIKLGMG